MKTKIDPNEKLRIDNYIKQAWHFDPELPSNDYQYVGRFTGNWTEQVQYLQFNQDSEFDYNRNKKTFDDKRLPDSIVSFGNEDREKAVKWGYDNKTHYHQKWNGLPEWCDLMGEASGLHTPAMCINEQVPGSFLPWHVDLFYTYCEQTGREIKLETLLKMRRYLVFLQDWKWGYYLQVGNNPITHWKAGDIITMPFGMYHLSVNAGTEVRHTMQINGLETDESIHKLPSKKIEINV
jgi:hypothetical protein